MWFTIKKLSVGFRSLLQPIVLKVSLPALNKQTIIGVLSTLIGVVAVLSQVGIDGLMNLFILFFLSVLSTFLWEMKINSWNKFYLLKLPLNLLLNIFWLILVVKWWTTRDLIREIKSRESKN
ncbi:MAG: hypothetical protein CMH22_11930 [Methylophaga sp.]|nr:hypothetical protein [Methylophaga sp.]